MAYFLFFIKKRGVLSLFGVFLIWQCLCACDAHPKVQSTSNKDLESIKVVLPGAFHLEAYLPILENKRIGLVVNHTSVIDQVHLVDSLLALNVDIRLIFAPEHGFKGTAYNGEEVKDGMYKSTIPIKSLYGKSRKPNSVDLQLIDVLIFDIQDVGARFYTYISTLHYVMEAAAENDKELIILDRPNPNGHYIDGPVIEDEFKSFVGMHSVPIVYGMTIGEYGQMINGEGWLKTNLQCKLTVIKNSNYTHQTIYTLPIPPSPNLPNLRAILLYPSLCLLEGTVMNEGRGTNQQFQIYGHPIMNKSEFSYTPVSMSSSKYPKHENKLCGGVDLTGLDSQEIVDWGQINLSYVITSFEEVTSLGEQDYFLKNGWFDKLAGTRSLREQILSGMSESQIRKSWQVELEKFKDIRRKYLLYP